MAYGESNVTCPMTKRNVKWSRLSHLSICEIKVTSTVTYNKALCALL